MIHLADLMVETTVKVDLSETDCLAQQLHNEEKKDKVRHACKIFGTKIGGSKI